MASSTAAKKPGASKTYCAVCPAWEIKHPDRCGNTLKRAGGTLYFCTKRCKERFEKDPATFTVK